MFILGEEENNKRNERLHIQDSSRSIWKYGMCTSGICCGLLFVVSYACSQIERTVTNNSILFRSVSVVYLFLWKTFCSLIASLFYLLQVLSCILSVVEDTAIVTKVFLCE